MQKIISSSQHWLVKEAFSRLDEFQENLTDRIKGLWFVREETFDRRSKRIRTERREAIVRVAKALLSHVCLSTFTVKKRIKRDGIVHYEPPSLEEISKIAGVSYWRAQRAMQDLRAAHCLKITKRYEKREDDTYKGLNSLRILTEYFFQVLGFSKEKMIRVRAWKNASLESSGVSENHESFFSRMKRTLSFQERRRRKKENNVSKQSSDNCNVITHSKEKLENIARNIAEEKPEQYTFETALRMIFKSCKKPPPD